MNPVEARLRDMQAGGPQRSRDVLAALATKGYTPKQQHRVCLMANTRAFPPNARLLKTVNPLAFRMLRSAGVTPTVFQGISGPSRAALTLTNVDAGELA